MPINKTTVRLSLTALCGGKAATAFLRPSFKKWNLKSQVKQGRREISDNLSLPHLSFLFF